MSSSPPSPNAASPSAASIPARPASSPGPPALAKTDRLDARALAQMGRTLSLPVTVPVSAARYDKTADSYLGFGLIAAVRLWMREFVNRT
ncbi:hypothetical protein [Xanthobacter cornucopiae]|uniref:hypothetical protein n=1 Tax=Xanthobacter cornucopiae TaxID=3119924 RepID=UPI00372D4D70